MGDALREDLAELTEPPAGPQGGGDRARGSRRGVHAGGAQRRLSHADGGGGAHRAPAQPLLAARRRARPRRGGLLGGLEYATGREATVVGKPSGTFFATALAELGTERAIMVGDDVEADVGGALAAGLPAVLVRTGKFRQDALESSGVVPTAIVDSIARRARPAGGPAALSLRLPWPGRAAWSGMRRILTRRGGPKPALAIHSDSSAGLGRSAPEVRWKNRPRAAAEARWRRWRRCGTCRARRRCRRA